MRKVGNSLLIIFLFCLTFISVSAESLGIIKGIYSYDAHPFTNQSIYLYKIADIKDLDSDDKFVYLESYSNFETNINTLNSSEWQKYANELKSYIEPNNLP
ncbi:MAG: hypothetical protein K2G03_04725, partial [Bacilli bacterium]|nr:hypothetical protein [Bacilli bacterium]